MSQLESQKRENSEEIPNESELPTIKGNGNSTPQESISQPVRGVPQKPQAGVPKLAPIEESNMIEAPQLTDQKMLVEKKLPVRAQNQSFGSTFKRHASGMFSDFPCLDYEKLTSCIYEQQAELNTEMKKLFDLPKNQKRKNVPFDVAKISHVAKKFEDLMEKEVQQVWNQVTKEVKRLDQVLAVNNNFIEERVLNIIQEIIHLVKYCHLNAQAVFHLFEKFDTVLAAGQFNLVFRVQNNDLLPLYKDFFVHQNLVNLFLDFTTKINYYKKLQSQPVMAAYELLENHFLLYQQNLIKAFLSKNEYFDEIYVKSQIQASRLSSEQEGIVEKRAIYDYLDLWLVLFHTFFYMLYYYGFFPNASQYSKALQVDEGTSGAIQAATPIAAAISCFYYTWHKNTSTLKQSYITSWMSTFIGLILYICADAAENVGIVVIGRLIFGWGGARVLTRTFVSNAVAFEFRTKYQAWMVAMTSLAMTFGPGTAAFLQYVPEFRLFGNFWVKQYTVFPYVMICVQFVSMIAFQFMFKDVPSHLKFCYGYRMRDQKFKNPTFEIGSNTEIQENNCANYDSSSKIARYFNIDHLLVGSLSLKEKINYAEIQPEVIKKKEKLLTKVNKKRPTTVGDSNNMMSDRFNSEQKELNPKSARYSQDHHNEQLMTSGQKKQYRQLVSREVYFNQIDAQDKVNDMSINHDYEVQPSRKIQTDQNFLQFLKVVYEDQSTFYAAFLFFFIKSGQEATLVEFPIMMNVYNEWSRQSIGFAMLGFTIGSLPSSLLPMFLSKKVSDRNMAFFFTCLFTIACLVKINYTYDQDMDPIHFVIASGFTFCCTLVVEASASAMLAKVISQKQNLTIFNSGMLAGLMDTSGRAFGSVMVTVFSKAASEESISFFLWIFYCAIGVMLIIYTIIVKDKLFKLQYVQKISK